MKSAFILILTIFTLSSCSLDDDDNTYVSIETLPIKQAIVPLEFEYGSVYTLKVVYDLPSGCHSFYNLFYKYENTARIIAINSLVNSNQACTEALIEKEHEFEVTVSQRENYIFKFWKGIDDEGKDIFEEIVVPVK